MANFVNNEPKFKVGDKVVYSRRRDDMCSWEKESISKGPLTIRRMDKFYNNGRLADVNYYVEGLDYVYSENWLSYAPAGPKFKIEDKVRVKIIARPICEITDVVTLTFASDNHTEYAYYLNGEKPYRFDEENLEAISNDELLIHDLEICGNKSGDCDECSYKNPDGTKTRDCYNQINLDAAELIKKLQKRVKELEEK